jgi:quinol monooxygenase YgiN
MTDRCIEIIAFTIRPECQEQFAAIKARVAAEAHALPGLLSSTTQRSLTEPGRFVDTMVWESRQAALAGRDAFAKLPSTPAFLGMMAGPPAFEGHFAWSAGDRALNLTGE